MDQAAAAGLISAEVACLTQEVLKTMLLTKLKSAAVLLLAVGLGIGVAGVGADLLTDHLAACQRDEPQTENSRHSASKSAERPSTDKDRLQGTWRVVAIEVGGKPWPEEEINKANATLHIIGNTFTLKRQGRVELVRTFHIGPTIEPEDVALNSVVVPQMPFRPPWPRSGPQLRYESTFQSAFKSIHLTAIEEGKPQTFPGIYDFDHGILRLAIPGANQKRPADFKTTANSGDAQVLVLIRLGEPDVSLSRSVVLTDIVRDRRGGKPCCWTNLLTRGSACGRSRGLTPSPFSTNSMAPA